MHLLVLSAFRPAGWHSEGSFPSRSQCTFWCSVLSDTKTLHPRLWGFCLNAPFGAQCFPTGVVVVHVAAARDPSQCTFWCSVLSDRVQFYGGAGGRAIVSMHLLVLSAFRPDGMLFKR